MPSNVYSFLKRAKNKRDKTFQKMLTTFKPCEPNIIEL